MAGKPHDTVPLLTKDSPAMSPKSDIEIARAASKQPIQDIGAKLGIPSQDLLPFGHDKAKVSAAFIKACLLYTSPSPRD